MSYPIGETTIGVLPEPIPATESGTTPVPAAAPSLLANNRTRAITNSTFVLNTSSTTPVAENRVMRLHNRTPAQMALIVLEAGAGAAPGAVLARFWMDGSHPSASNGLQLKEGGVYEVVGSENILNFRIVSADDKPHVLQVQYFM